MSRKYSNTQRALASRAILEMDAFWAKTFADTGTSDLNYCDLFTHLWLVRDQPPQPKTELYPLMPNISRRTAVKYVQQAIERGMLEEQPCDSDRRIRLVSLTPQAIELIERFLDYTCLSFSAVGKES
ncbi:hypothetical protein QQF45_06455 [Halopseudomonas aestusnigri]|jgi:hypothetical protein|uniref:hypothetical protein n=1 Tax=Halopseudomonas TaxID=2901189 RepID=UPI0022B71053|nr:MULTISPECIES: hypothetical protein [Halopseudomonas]MDL2198708.1 hypothetical protein [Halopseudomonas aestusnigri]BDX18151.1 hypothetical protein MFKK_09610 [Halopseudomonas aestusnigri]